MDAEPLVEVEVMVNVDGLRRGWRGQVELTRRIQMLADRGYLRLLGHVNPVPEAPPALSQPVLPAETPSAPARPSRTKRKATTTQEGTDGDSESDPGVQ